MNRFTVYRRNIGERDTHNHLQKNADDAPQFEGVIFSDGTVAIRWLTACRSTSVWASIEDCLNIHGHPEYGTFIVWHDGPTPAFWLDALGRFDSAGLQKELWEAAAAFQHTANECGFGTEWERMCRERTIDAAYDVSTIAYDTHKAKDLPGARAALHVASKVCGAISASLPADAAEHLRAAIECLRATKETQP
jgi:hypothetical protein